MNVIPTPSVPTAMAPMSVDVEKVLRVMERTAQVKASLVHSIALYC